MIVDARIRPPLKEFLELSIYAADERSSTTAVGVHDWPPSILEASFDALLAEMDDAGIGRGVVHGRHAGSAFGSVPNDTVAQVRSLAPGRFWLLGGVGAGSVQEDLREARRCIEELDFDGLSLDPGWLSVPLRADDGRFYPIYAYCEEKQVPVFITLGVFSGTDLTYSDPVALQHVAAAFPQLTIVVTHAAWPWTRQVVATMVRHKNVWLLPDFYMNIPGMPGSGDYVEAANSFVGDRILYGSSYPGRPLAQALAEVRELGLDGDALERLTSTNAHRLFPRAPR